MAVRAALLTSRNINLDSDFSKYIETVSDPGVITGFAVTASAVATGQAWVPCERTNGETIYTFVQNFNSVAISGNGYVIISIPQNIVDNWGGNEDGTGIASIEVVNELPAKNYLLLATITGGIVEDNRNMIHTVWELKTDIDSIFAAIENLDERVTALELISTINHLEERALVWENYSLSDTLFKQLTPKLADSTVAANVWDIADNKEIHIQRLGSGTASNTLKLKMKKAGAPTTDVKVEVRNGIKVNVSSSEAYWYWDSTEILATGTLSNSSFSSSWQEVTFNLDAEVGGIEGQLLDIVVYQTTGDGAIVNASNYYILACDSTQRSEWFSFVSVNWSTRSRSKLMPYCVSSGFAQAMLCKIDTLIYEINNESKNIPQNWQDTTLYNLTFNKDLKIEATMVLSNYSSSWGSYGNDDNLQLNWTVIHTGGWSSRTGTINKTFTWNNFNLVWHLKSWYWYSISVNTTLKAYYENNKKKILAFTLKSIWENLNGYLFGMLPSGTWWDGN